VTPPDGLPDDMHRPFAARRDVLTLDEGTATRLLAGQLDPSDAPPGYGDVASVLAAASAPARPHELASEEGALEVFRAAGRTRPARRRRVGPLVAVLTVAVLVLGGGAAATATGSLPGPAQGVAHDALGAVGVSVPSASHAARQTPVVHPPTIRSAPRPVAPHPTPRRRRVPSSTPAPTAPRSPPPRGGPNRSSLVVALCRAYDAGRLGNGAGRSSRGYQVLAGLAGGEANIPGYCRSVLN
jgi:hypothetical protein